jgi:hypothetical protein
MWQFPPGPPYALLVIGAQVNVLQKRMVAAGGVTYSDETVNSGSAPLDPRLARSVSASLSSGAARLAAKVESPGAAEIVGRTVQRKDRDYSD